MIREFGLDQIRQDPAAMVTVGTFDGVHLGHQHIIRYLIRRAAEKGLRSTVVTFDPHPRQVVTGHPVPLLTTLEERAEVLAALGLHRMVVLPFTKAFSRMTSEEFVLQMLVERIGLREIAIGYDHGFGRNREGNSETLYALGRQHDFSVHVIPAQTVGEVVVSSSKIREALEEAGDMEQTRQLLGRYYTLSGQVVQGQGRGRAFGFPTANLDVVHPQKIIPRTGVYAVRVVRPQTGQVHSAMMNVGYRPTVSTEQRLTLEVHLLDFKADLYGEVLHVRFIHRIRDEQKFASIEALVKQLAQDRQNCIAVLEDVS